MTAKDDSPAPAGTALADDLAEVIRLLTAIARRTYRRPNGEEAHHDFGEVITTVVTATAANVGGVDELLAGRPGSWEADYVRQIVQSTTGGDNLEFYRTEPIKLVLDPEEVFEDVGLRELFDEEDDDLAQGYSNGTEPDDGGENDSRIDDRRALLEQIYKSDLDRYFADYAESLRQIGIERSFAIPVELERVSEYATEPHANMFTDALHTAARDRTPLPSGIALQDYEGSVAEIERAAHRSYVDRLRNQTGS